VGKYLEDLRTRSEQSVLSDRISPSDGAGVWWDNPAASRAIDPVPRSRPEKTLPRCSYASIGRNLPVDADTKHFKANAAFQNLLGYTSDQVLRLTLYDVVVEN